MKASIINWDKKECGSVTLPEWLMEEKTVRYDVMHRVVRWQDFHASERSRAVKSRAMVVARKGKPFRQKGTGRARQGTVVAPHMRGGGVTFSIGAKRSFLLQKRVRRMGLRSALALRAQNQSFFIMDDVDFTSAKTKDVVQMFRNNAWDSFLFVNSSKESSPNLMRATANLKGVAVLPVQGLNVKDTLKHKMIVVHRDALDGLMEKVRF